MGRGIAFHISRYFCSPALLISPSASSDLMISAPSLKPVEKIKAAYRKMKLLHAGRQPTVPMLPTASPHYLEKATHIYPLPCPFLHQRPSLFFFCCFCNILLSSTRASIALGTSHPSLPGCLSTPHRSSLFLARICIAEQQTGLWVCASMCS